MSEVGAIGMYRTRPIGVNDQHVMLDQLALIQAARRVGEIEVDALLVSNLLLTAPRILLNVDRRSRSSRIAPCGCPLDDLGLHTTCATCAATRSSRPRA
jgi:hypothetical protein